MSGIFIFLIISRSSLDVFTNTRILFSFLNVPSLVGFLIILAAGASLSLDIGKQKMRTHPIAVAWLGWLVFLTISVALGFVYLGWAGTGGAKEWIRLLTIGTVFALSFSIFRDGRSGRKALDLLFLALPVPLLTGLAQWVFRTGHIVKGKHRVLGTMAHANSLGLFLVFFIGLTYWKYRTSKRLPWLALLFLELFVLSKTLYIGGYIMLAVLLAFFFFREGRKGKIPVVLLAVFFAGIVLTARDSREKLTEVNSLSPSTVSRVLSGGKPSGSFSWRIAQWSELVKLWTKKPVLGHGLHATVVINPVRSQGAGFPPHNDYLRYLVETGAVGLLVYLALMALCGILLFRAFRSARDRDVKNLLFALLGVFAAWLIGGFAGNVMNMTSSQFCFWFALGTALSLAERERSTPGERQERRSGVTFIYPLEPGGRKIGGIETFIRGVATSLPASWDVRIAGVVTKESGLSCGSWQALDFFGRKILFFPVIRVDDPNKRTRIPMFFRFSLGLLRWRSRMDLEGRILSFHHLEPALALAGVRASRLFFAHGDVRDIFNPSSESRWKNIRWIYQGLERLVIGSMSRIFVVNRAGCDYYRRRYPKIRDRFSFMPAAFDPRVFFVRKDLDRKAVLARYGVRDRSSIVLFVGRLEEQKTPFLLLDSFRLILGTFPDAVLLIVGQGLLEEGLKKRAQELSLAGNVFWLGPKSGSEVAELMNVSTILFLTSAFEGMPRVVMEALACGLPVVSTDAGDVRLVVKDGSNGRIVPSRDPEAIARAAMEVLKAPPRFDPSRPPVSEYALDKVLQMVTDELAKIRNEES